MCFSTVFFDHQLIFFALCSTSIVSVSLDSIIQKPIVSLTYFQGCPWRFLIDRSLFYSFDEVKRLQLNYDLCLLKGFLYVSEIYVTVIKVRAHETRN